MKIQQLSLFVENEPGQIQKPCRLLAAEGINIRTLSVADTRQFGILRLIVPDWERANRILKDAGYVVKVTEVVAIEVPDRPGGLSGVMEALENSGVNIEYMYAFPFGRGATAVLIFRFDQPDLAIQRLQAAGINVVAGVDLLGREETAAS
ncbi:MAG: ACT domain-containing protein [Bryobacteraceae bacterium]